MTDDPLGDFLACCRAHQGGEPDEALRRAAGRFMDAAAADRQLARQAAEALSALPPDGAALAAVILGSSMETHGGERLSGPGVVDLLMSWLPRLATGEAALLRAAPLLCQSAVSHLARMPDERLALGTSPAVLDLLERAAEHTHGAGWVHDAVLRRSGSLIVLHPTGGVGFRIRYTNLANCFHLFSLIQVAVGPRIPGGRAPDPRIAAAAREPDGSDPTDEAWWHYGDPRSPVADLAASIWGEGAIDDIPLIDGSRIILMWPPLMGGRTWNGGFFSTQLQAMPPDAAIEAPLTPAECAAWSARLGVAPAPASAALPAPAPAVTAAAPRKPWWRFGR